jgi:hypothetical protein
MSRVPEGLRELLVFACAYLTYFGVRALTEGSAPRAMRNAADVVHVERWLHVDWEAALQEQVLRHPLLVDLANAVYVYGHWPMLILGGLLLFRYRRQHYYRLRNAILLTGSIGLVVFTVFPVAPPRLSGLAVIDTVSAGLGEYRQILPRSLVNEYAAMPSFHAGWNLLLGLVVLGATTRPLLRLVAVTGPTAMCLAVVATANHFVVDVVVGVAISVCALVLLHVLDPRGRPTLGETDAGGAVRRGAPGGERSRHVAPRASPGPSPRRGGRASVRLAVGGPSSQDARADTDPVGHVGAGTAVERAAAPRRAAGGRRDG